MAVDWLKIKNDYVSGGGSYRDMARKYSVSTKSISEHAKAEGWRELRVRQENKTSAKLQQKTREKISELLSEEAAAKARIRAKLIKMADDWLEDQTGVMKETTNYRRVVQCCMDMGLFDKESGTSGGAQKEDDPLTKALKEEAERLDNGDFS